MKKIENIGLFYKSVAFWLVMTFFCQSAFAAQVQIENTASMKYKNAPLTLFNAKSNTVFTVKKDNNFDITVLPFTGPSCAEAPPLGTWLYPVTFINSGTTKTDYDLSVINLPVGINSKIYQDTNKNGILEAGENPITSTTILNPNDQYSFIVELKDNVGKKLGDTFPFNVNIVSKLNATINSSLVFCMKLPPVPPPAGSGSSSGGSGGNSNPVPTPSSTATPIPSLKSRLQKSVFPVGSIKAGDPLTYYLAFTNESNVDISNVDIVDKIPDNTTLIKDTGAEPMADNGGIVEYSDSGLVWNKELKGDPRFVKFKYSLVNKLQTVTTVFKVKTNETLEKGTIENSAFSEFKDPLKGVTFKNLSNIVSNDIRNEYSIVGTINDIPTGLPKEGVKIEVYDETGKKIGEVITGKTGKYKIPVPSKGNYRTVITDTDSVVVSDVMIAIEKTGEKPTPIEFEGIIKGSQDDDDFSDVLVELFDETLGVVASFKTDKDAHFSFLKDKNGKEFKPGIYSIKITDKNGNVKYAKLSINAREGDTFLDIEAFIDPFGTVYDAKGGRNVRIEGAKVELKEGACNSDPTKDGPLVKLSDLEPNVSQKNPAMTPVNGTYQYFLNKDQLNNKSYCLIASKNGYSTEKYVLKTSPSTETPNRWVLSITDKEGKTKILKNVESIPHHIPLMPNSIFDLTKTANKSTTEIGDIVTYKLEATNKLMFKVKDAHVEDIIPSGFSYIPNSLYVDGKKIEDFVPTSSSVLMLPVGDLGPEQKVTIFYQLKVGINVVEGPAKNQANLQAVSPSGETLKGGDVTSTVFVKKGVFSKNGSIIGRLYIDSEDIGYTNKENGDTSLENISIYTANGIKITTDSKGKYSIPDLPNGDLLLSLDTKTLPKNVYLPDEGIKIANERKEQLEKSTVSKIDVNKAITYNIIEGKDLTLKNSSGMKATIELKDGKAFIVKNNSNLYASNKLGIGVSNNERIVNQKDLGLIKGLNEFKVNFFDLNDKIVKTKNIRINVLADVKIPKKDFWIGNTGISRRVIIPASGLAKANFRLVRLEPFELSLKTSEEEKDKPTNALRAVYVYPNKFTTKQLPYITYPDIQNHWSKEIVEYESALEIIHGYPDGTFKPGRSITRSEATKLVLVAIKSFDVKIGTSLGYIINTDAKVTAKIIDKNGKAIKTFFSGIDKKAGVNVMYWDGKGDDGKLLEPAKYTFEVIVNSSTVTKILKTDMEVITPIPNYHPNGKALFPDVPEWYWGTSFIKVANEEKIISGYKDGNFLPDKFIPRYEMAELAVKALGLDISLASDKLKFKDADQVPDFAKKYVYLAEMYGLLRAFPDGNFYPLRNTNRADIANLVLELINRQKVDTDIAGSIVDEINELNVEGQKLNLEKDKKFLIKVKKKYSDDVNVTTFETDKLKVIIDELYKNKGVKRGLFDSFGN